MKGKKGMSEKAAVHEGGECVRSNVQEAVIIQWKPLKKFSNHVKHQRDMHEGKMKNEKY